MHQTIAWRRCARVRRRASGPTALGLAFEAWWRRALRVAQTRESSPRAQRAPCGTSRSDVPGLRGERDSTFTARPRQSETHKKEPRPSYNDRGSGIDAWR